MAALAAILGGAAVFMMFAYAVRARMLRPSEARIRYLTPRQDLVVEKVADGKALLKRDASSIPAFSRMLGASGYAARWALELERAEVKLRPSEYLMVRLMLGLVAAAFITLLGRSAIAFVVGIPIGAIMYMMPAYWLRLKTQRRTDKINAQLVETITLIGNALRAGFAFAQAVDVAAKRMGPPMSVELNRMLLDVNLGSTVEDALSAMSQRIGGDDVDMVVTAILIQRNTGGNLAEVLEQVTTTMRDRERIQGEIKTMTSSQRLTGWVLSLWPVTLGLLFYVVSPATTSMLWKSQTGLFLLGIWVVLNFLGVYSLRRILSIDI